VPSPASVPSGAHDMNDNLPWVLPWHRRCKAVKEPGEPYWGRCELRAGHQGDHALERGMETPRWSTEWTA
jgi:hypothetical protein